MSHGISGMRSRRDLLRAAMGGLVLVPGRGRGGAWAAGEDSLIVRKADPYNAEAPVPALDAFITPTERLFVRSHYGAPRAILPDEVAVSGMVKSRTTMGRAEIGDLEKVTVAALLQCSGNGRASFSPGAPGVAWDRGAVGNAEWTGVRLRDILEKAGLDPSARHVHFRGHDDPSDPKAPPFFRSLPIDRAMDPTTLVAFGLNGDPLPRDHGGPFRLIVPGWTGNHWMKWLRSVAPDPDEAPGSFQRADYRLPRRPTRPGEPVRPEDTDAITAMNVKSLIVSPAPGIRVKGGEFLIRGTAWTGLGRVAKVEVSIDRGPWTPATLRGPDREGAWRLWDFSWKATPGTHEVRSRATDSRGEVQPEKTTWNSKGYMWNGIDVVTFDVANL